MSHLTKKHKDLFDALHNSRAEDYKVFSKKDYGGLFRSVIDKYPESAHFVYELLQNADDALATTARFILEKNRLIFAHNGKRHFSVTNPAQEDADSENKTLGDINSIASIANSNKKGASIGKFGVVFMEKRHHTYSLAN